MKKSILIILVAACFVNTGNAQQKASDDRDTSHFGLKAGVNYSNVYDSKGDNFVADGKVGFAGGVFVSIPITKYVGIQPEILFSQKGFKATGNFLGTPYDLTRTSNYIDVPIFLAIKPVNNISILAGLQYSFLLKQKDVFNNATMTVVQEQNFSNENIQKNTFCLTGGVDYNMKNIVLSARGGWDVKNNNGDGTSTTPRYKNTWYQLTVGYRFL